MKWESGTAVSLGTIHPLSNEDLLVQFKLCQLHRCAWFGLLALIVAALLGVFGGEYTFKSDSWQTATGVDYPYLTRASAPVTLKVHSENAREIWVSSGLARSINLQNVWPKPLAIKTVNDKLLLSFARAPDEVILTVRARMAGFVEGKIGSEREAFSVGFFAIP